MLTYGSLFSGIGGFDLGFDRAGMRGLWQSDIDPYCLRVLEKHWPDVLRVPDIRDVGADTVPPVDIICGGFPCQDISVAGRGAGIDGARSGLWSEYARVIGELRPRYVVVENVSALLARGVERVLGDLAALGYDAEWDCIPASAFGAPHQRDRVWLVAYPECDELWQQSGRRRGTRGLSAPVAGHDGSARPLADTTGAGCTAQHRERGKSLGLGPSGATSSCGQVADPEREGLAGRRGPGAADGGGQAGGLERLDEVERGYWSVEPDVGRVADGVPARVDRLRALGNSLVPQVAEWIGRRIVDWEGGLT